MTSRNLLVWLLIALFTLPVPAAMGQAFDAKPINFPWKIAFIRDRNLWVMNGDGSNARSLTGFGNVTGRLSWAPDGKRVAFARQGQSTYELPDGGGGQRRLYDIFAKHIDSTRESAWWWVTLNHGSHSPEWSRDGEYILYIHDVNANIVDAETPDYQIEFKNWDGTVTKSLRRAGAAPRESMGLQPTWSPDRSQVAFIYFDGLKPVGLLVEPGSGITRAEANLIRDAGQFINVFGPQWSPDGKWIAYVNTEDHDNGIYIVSPDLKEKRRVFDASGGVIPHRAPVSWSPDSKWLAFSSTIGYIYVIGVDGKNLTRLSSGGNDYYPAIAPR